MKAISCVWGASAASDAERIRRHCAAVGWELLAEARKTGVEDGAVGWMLAVTECTGADYLVLTRGEVADLERELTQLWPRVREVLEDTGVAVVTV